jgi:hypothetical protein
MRSLSCVSVELQFNDPWLHLQPPVQAKEHNTDVKFLVVQNSECADATRNTVVVEHGNANLSVIQCVSRTALLSVLAIAVRGRQCWMLLQGLI